MDMSQLDRRGMAAQPRFLHLKDPETGADLYDGETAIGVTVVGLHSRRAQELISARMRGGMTAPDGAVKTAEDMQADLVQLAAGLTAEVVGVTKGGRPFEPGEFAEFYDLTFLDVMVSLGKSDKPGSFAQQVDRFVGDAANFLTVA